MKIFSFHFFFQNLLKLIKRKRKIISNYKFLVYIEMCGDRNIYLFLDTVTFSKLE